MRVLHLASWHPNRVHPQLGNFVRRHIEALPEGLENVVVHAWPDPQLWPWDKNEVVERVDSNGIRTFIVYVPDFPPRRLRMERAVSRFCLEKFSGQCQPHLIHLHVAAEAAMPAMSLAAQWKIPFVISENWTAYHGEFGRSFRWVEERAVRRVLPSAALLMPVSKSLGRAMAPFAPDVRQSVVPNVVEARFSPPSTPREPSAPLRLLHVSSMQDDHKNISGMLRAFGQACQAWPGITLDLVGGAGEVERDLERYQSLVLELGISKQVHFHGPVDSDGVANVMRSTDCFVLFSRYETFGCVILEAWMSGMPVVATEVGGLTDVLKTHPELGEVISIDDESALTRAIITKAHEKAQGQFKDTSVIHGFASQRYPSEAVGKAFVDAYRSVLG